ncbi:MAG: hypothetical protein Cons2KO_05850 [Congregibacter sp.]
MDDAPKHSDFGFDYQYGLAAWVKNAQVAEGARPRRGPMYPDNFYRDNELVGPTQKFSAELVSDDALRWLAGEADGLDAQNADDDQQGQPFFLLLTYSEVHTPIASPERHLKTYEEFLSNEARDNPWLYYFDWRDRPWRGRGEYYANISFLDEQLGRVLDYLRADDQLDNTLVIFSSDNGPVTDAALTPWELGMAGETGGLRGKKRFLFEGGLRVPGILRYPARVSSGQVIDTPVTALDVFPSLARLLEVPVSPDIPLDGQSIWPLLDADSGAEGFVREAPLYWSIPTPDGMEFALRWNDWKLILDAEEKPIYLFDLAEDRYEVSNLLAERPDVTEQLMEMFLEKRAAIEADPLAVSRDQNYQARP